MAFANWVLTLYGHFFMKQACVYMRRKSTLSETHIFSKNEGLHATKPTSVDCAITASAMHDDKMLWGKMQYIDDVLVSYAIYYVVDTYAGRNTIIIVLMYTASIGFLDVKGRRKYDLSSRKRWTHITTRLIKIVVKRCVQYRPRTTHAWWLLTLKRVLGLKNGRRLL